MVVSHIAYLFDLYDIQHFQSCLFFVCQFHANCIDPWLRQQGTCPVCKFSVGSGWQDRRESESDGSDMV